MRLAHPQARHRLAIAFTLTVLVQLSTTAQAQQVSAVVDNYKTITELRKLQLDQPSTQILAEGDPLLKGTGEFGVLRAICQGGAQMQCVSHYLHLPKKPDRGVVVPVYASWKVDEKIDASTRQLTSQLNLQKETTAVLSATVEALLNKLKELSDRVEALEGAPQMPEATQEGRQ